MSRVSSTTTHVLTGLIEQIPAFGKTKVAENAFRTLTAGMSHVASLSSLLLVKVSAS